MVIERSSMREWDDSDTPRVRMGIEWLVVKRGSGMAREVTVAGTRTVTESRKERWRDTVIEREGVGRHVEGVG